VRVPNRFYEVLKTFWWYGAPPEQLPHNLQFAHTGSNLEEAFQRSRGFLRSGGVLV